MSQVEFRGRLVAPTYPARHAEAQQVTAYDDFADKIRRDRIPYGAPKDRYPGGKTPATREQILATQRELREDELAFLHAQKAAGSLSEDLFLERLREIDWLCPPDPSVLFEREGDAGLRLPDPTDRRCPDCDVEVGEFHLPGCHVEMCPKCEEQAISCGCTRDEGDE